MCPESRNAMAYGTFLDVRQVALAKDVISLAQLPCVGVKQAGGVCNVLHYKICAFHRVRTRCRPGCSLWRRQRRFGHDGTTVAPWRNDTGDIGQSGVYVSAGVQQAGCHETGTRE